MKIKTTKVTSKVDLYFLKSWETESIVLKVNIIPLINFSNLISIFYGAQISSKRGWRITGDMPTCGAIAVVLFVRQLILNHRYAYQAHNSQKNSGWGGERREREIATYRMEIGVAMA